MQRCSVTCVYLHPTLAKPGFAKPHSIIQTNSYWSFPAAKEEAIPHHQEWHFQTHSVLVSFYTRCSQQIPTNPTSPHVANPINRADRVFVTTPTVCATRSIRLMLMT